MSKTPLSLPILQHVFHPSDFSPASETAFAHALKVALVAKATLTIFHVSSDRKEDWTEFPGVRQTLERWGILPERQPQVCNCGAGHSGQESRCSGQGSGESGAGVS